MTDEDDSGQACNGAGHGQEISALGLLFVL